MYVVLNGKFVEAGKAFVPVADHGFLFGDGIYETLRTYGGRVWQINEHLKRLEASAKMLKIGLPWGRGKIAGWVEGLVKKNGFKESRIRVTVTRGRNGTVFTDSKKPTLLIQSVELKAQPPAVYAKGVDAITVKMKRTLPLAKTISLLPMVLAWQELARRKAYEAIYTDERGRVLEGTITNIFMVKKGITVTPKSGILKGTTRQAVMKAARGAGISIKQRDFTVRSLRGADEVFITNAPRGIIPVRSVDGVRIGKGRPGPVTEKITEAFEKLIWRNISSARGKSCR
jgi:branched-chain amino acid aminotransferase